MSSSTRNVLACVGGAMLGLVLLLSGAWITFQIVMRGDSFGTNIKDKMVSLYLIQALILFPIVGLAVGLLVGWLVQVRWWWLAGLSLSPLLIYSLVRGGWDRPNMILSAAYLLLSLGSAFGISRWRRSATFNRRGMSNNSIKQTRTSLSL